MPKRDHRADPLAATRRSRPGVAIVRIALLGLVLGGAGFVSTGTVTGTAPSDDPYEPNDAWSDAAVLSSGESIEAWIYPDKDEDWFRLQITRAGDLQVRLESLPADYDLAIAHYNPQTQQLDDVPYENHFGTTNEVFGATVQATGTYYIRVYSVPGAYDEADGYLLTATWPEPLPPTENVLRLGAAQGVAGTQASLGVILENENAAKALQLDMQFDPDIMSYTGGGGVARGGAMTFSAALQAPDRLRLLLYSDDDAYIASGSGAVAYASFVVTGEPGEVGIAMPLDVRLSSLDAQALDVSAEPGSLQVLSGQAQPHVSLYVLKNPGRPRSVHVYAVADQALAQAPTVSAGADVVTMIGIDASENIYFGTLQAADAADSLTLNATAFNGVASGTAATTVVF